MKLNTKSAILGAAIFLSSLPCTTFAVEHNHGHYTYEPVTINGTTYECPCDLPNNIVGRQFRLEFSKQEEIQDLINNKNKIKKSKNTANNANTKGHNHRGYNYEPVTINGTTYECPCDLPNSAIYRDFRLEFNKQEEIQDLLRNKKKYQKPRYLSRNDASKYTANNKSEFEKFNYNRHCLNYSEARVYQRANNHDIHAEYETMKDITGEKDKWLYFSFLSSDGLLNTGNTDLGVADRTFINYIINYGFENSPIEPYACIVWEADLAGDPTRGYEPKVFRILFEDKYVKTFDLQGWEYKKKFVHGIFFNDLAHSYSGTIKLSRFDVFEMSKHGAVVSASIDAGNGGIKHFFYTGNKNKEDKELLTRAFQHSLILLGIDSDKMQAEYIAYKQQQEEERIAKIRAEVEAEIKAEQEREVIKQQILKEMKLKEANNTK